MNDNMIKRAIRDGNFGAKVMCALWQMTGCSNRQIATLGVRYKGYLYYCKHYKKYIKQMEFENDLDVGDTNGSDNVWICWWQGLDNAPALVKACVDSVYKYMPNKKIHIITMENVREYVDFPDWIWDKWERHIINNTKLSNLLRMELLIKYGGLWLDATILLTGEIPEWVYSRNMFFYSTDRNHDMTRCFNNFFIYSVKGQRYLKAILQLHYIYWKQEKKVREYFQWHLFANMCAEKYRDDIEKIVYIPDQIPHMLAHVIFEKYDKMYWEEICRVTPIHKLSNKWDVNCERQDTYYEHILNGIDEKL